MKERIFAREREIEKLQRLLASEKPEFLAIYGRRRVGKTYLIQEFFKDKGIFFFFLLEHEMAQNVPKFRNFIGKSNSNLKYLMLKNRYRRGMMRSLRFMKQ